MFLGSFETDFDQASGADFIPCSHIDFIMRLYVVKTVALLTTMRCYLIFFVFSILSNNFCSRFELVVLSVGVTILIIYNKY